MDLTTITISKEAAEAAFREYRAAFRANANRVDGEIMRGYKALREGKLLLRLTETITAGGVNEKGEPRLAFGRADERVITYQYEENGSVTFGPGFWNISAADRVHRFPAGTLPTWEYATRPASWRGQGLQAIMPVIPPRLRPVHSLTGYHVLWEAVWARAPRAPRDPALLKHIGGDLYAVLAVWDLTDLERAVLEMRQQ